MKVSVRWNTPTRNTQRKTLHSIPLDFPNLSSQGIRASPSFESVSLETAKAVLEVETSESGFLGVVGEG
jgi:hypothetical protein